LLLRLHRLARWLRPLLPWCHAIGFGAAALALYLVFRDDSGATQLLAVALGVTVWALMLFAFIRLFQSIPAPVLPGDSFLERLRARCKLGLYQLLALSVLLVSLALVVMSLKLLSVSL
jgi:phosphoglycerol transferase MdoB-like AlkP superfamily enzyme